MKKRCKKCVSAVTNCRVPTGGGVQLPGGHAWLARGPVHGMPGGVRGCRGGVRGLTPVKTLAAGGVCMAVGGYHVAARGGVSPCQAEAMRKATGGACVVAMRELPYKRRA